MPPPGLVLSAILIKVESMQGTLFLCVWILFRALNLLEAYPGLPVRNKVTMKILCMLLVDDVKPP